MSPDERSRSRGSGRFWSSLVEVTMTGEILATAEICLKEWKPPQVLDKIKDVEAALQNITSAMPSTSLAQN